MEKLPQETLDFYEKNLTGYKDNLIKEIKFYMHCKDCIKELPKNQSAAEYARLNVGLREEGIVVICTRHDEIVATFKGNFITEEMKCSCQKKGDHDGK